MELVITGIFLVLAVLGLVYTIWLLYTEFTLKKSPKVQLNSINEHETKEVEFTSLLNEMPIIHELNFGQKAVSETEPPYSKYKGKDSVKYRLNGFFKECFDGKDKTEIINSVKLTKPKQPSTETKKLPNFKQPLVVLLRSGKLAIVDTFNGRQNPTISGIIGEIGNQDLKWEWHLNGKSPETDKPHYMDIISIIGELDE